MQLMKAEVVPSGGNPILGHSWPVAAFPYEEALAAVYPDNIVSWVSAGRIKAQDSPVIIDADAADIARRWTAQSANVTRAVDSAVLGGLPRFNGGGKVAAGVNGLYATLGAALSSYTFGVLARVSALAETNCFVNVGPSSTDRVMFYVSSANKIGIQHTASDLEAGADSVTVDAWLPLLASYDASDNTIKVYHGSTTPIINSTFTADPGSSALASLCCTRDGLYELTGEIALSVIWNRALHTDAAAVAAAMAALVGLSEL